ncbi:hypothetical protein AMTRI_Chr04g189650 [Amborella trichopoda]
MNTIVVTTQLMMNNLGNLLEIESLLFPYLADFYCSGAPSYPLLYLGYRTYSSLAPFYSIVSNRFFALYVLLSSSLVFAAHLSSSFKFYFVSSLTCLPYISYLLFLMVKCFKNAIYLFTFSNGPHIILVIAMHVRT